MRDFDRQAFEAAFEDIIAGSSWQEHDGVLLTVPVSLRSRTAPLRARGAIETLRSP